MVRLVSAVLSNLLSCLNMASSESLIMNKKTYIFILLYLALIIQQASAGAPPTFRSYEQAVDWYQSQKLETIYPRSTAIYQASYHERDSVLLIYFVSKPSKGYVYGGVPLKIWNEFKNADSKGGYYNARIKGRYSFYLQ
jgi:hypothetical protein